MDSQAIKYPRPEFRVRIDWTCDPARVQSLVQRVFEEIAEAKTMRLNADQMARVRDILTRELDQDRRENGYLRNQLARRYEDRETEAAGSSPLPDIAAHAGAAIQQAAQVPARRAFSGSS